MLQIPKTGAVQPFKKYIYIYLFIWLDAYKTYTYKIIVALHIIIL